MEQSKLSKQAIDFVKNNCMTWCNFEGCSTRECEKKIPNMEFNPQLEDQHTEADEIINQEMEF